MLTTTAFVSRTILSPLAWFELPLTSPPPWMNTYTGIRDPRPLPVGRCTLTNRQFSAFDRGPLVLASAAHVAPYCVADLIPLHHGAGWGARHRRLPTGGAAYGMPRKLSTPSACEPRTAPL